MDSSSGEFELSETNAFECDSRPSECPLAGRAVVTVVAAGIGPPESDLSQGKTRQA